MHWSLASWLYARRAGWKVSCRASTRNHAVPRLRRGQALEEPTGMFQWIVIALGENADAVNVEQSNGLIAWRMTKANNLCISRGSNIHRQETFHWRSAGVGITTG